MNSCRDIHEHIVVYKQPHVPVYVPTSLKYSSAHTPEHTFALLCPHLDNPVLFYQRNVSGSIRLIPLA